MDVIIRKAVPKDAKGFVEVNTYTWMTTYKGLMPDKLLEDRLKNMNERIPITAQNIKEKNNIYVAEIDNKIVGIMSYGKSTNDKYPDFGEIYAIYVLDEYQGKKIGKKLFLKGIEELINIGYKSMILNVLDGNKTINFYQKYSGRKIDELHRNFGGIKLKENIMYFENLGQIYSTNKLRSEIMSEDYITITNDYYEIYIPKSYEKYGYQVLNFSTEKLKENLAFFKEKSFGTKIKGAFLTTREDYVNRVHLYEPDHTPPKWAGGGYYGDEAMILLEPDKLEKRFATLAHESFHLLFDKFIYKKNNMNRIIWLDESLANNLDGRMPYRLKNGYLEKTVVKLNKLKKLPKMNELDFQKNVKTNDYDGYDFFIIVGRYLIETMSDDELFAFINNESKVKEAGETILKDSIDYFIQKYNLVNKGVNVK